MSEGLAALANMHHAELLRRHARQLRANASMYSTEYDWVQDAYKSANEAEKEAEFYDRRSSNKRR